MNFFKVVFFYESLWTHFAWIENTLQLLMIFLSIFIKIFLKLQIFQTIKQQMTFYLSLSMKLSINASMRHHRKIILINNLRNDIFRETARCQSKNRMITLCNKCNSLTELYHCTNEIIFLVMASESIVLNWF